MSKPNKPKSKRVPITAAERAERKANEAKYAAMDGTPCDRCGVKRMVFEEARTPDGQWTTSIYCRCASVGITDPRRYRAIARCLAAYEAATK